MREERDESAWNDSRLPPDSRPVKLDSDGDSSANAVDSSDLYLDDFVFRVLLRIHIFIGRISVLVPCRLPSRSVPIYLWTSYELMHHNRSKTDPVRA